MKICFVSLNIYPSLTSRYDTKVVGGAELQQCYIGIGLRDKGYKVSYITKDNGGTNIELFNEMIIYKTFKNFDGIIGLRFIYPRLYKIWKALKLANADIYYTRGATFLPGIVALFCKMYSRKLVHSAASNTDFVKKDIRIKFRRDKLLYELALRKADFIIAQTNAQKNQLLENFNKNAIVIHNFSPGTPKLLNKSERENILWVSNFRSIKRPHQFLELAKAFPDEKFIMIGGPAFYNKQLYYNIRQKGKELKNLSFLGFQTPAKVEEQFDRCKILINTSKYEGFPNTYLQAWMRGVPVITYIDPDKIIEKNKLGTVVREENELKEALELHIKNEFCEYEKIVNYFNENHSINIINRYDKLFKNILVSSPI